MKLVLRRTTVPVRTSMESGRTRKYTIMSDHVLPCTAVYCHVQPEERTRTYRYVLLYIYLYQYVTVPVRTSMYRHAKIDQKYVLVLTLGAYMAVSTGMYCHTPGV